MRAGLLTGKSRIGLDQPAAALAKLAKPAGEVKILVDPRRS